jgi:hypothetical protein
MSKVPEGQSMPYHENLGITKIGYLRLWKISENVEVESTGIEEIEIIRGTNSITFKANGRLLDYNLIEIRTDTNLIYYDQQILEN